MSSSILKKLSLVAGILVILWVAYLYRQVPRFQSPFANADSQAIHIQLTRGPKIVELLKQGSDWKVSIGTTTAPADESQVIALLSSLKDVQVEDEISNRADRAADYDVTPESGTLVCLWGAQPSPFAKGIFGKQAADYAHIYFRYPDKPNVYLARGLMRGELGQPDPDSWIKKEKK